MRGAGAGSLWQASWSSGLRHPLSSPASHASLQFVLKHSAFAHLREVALFPNTLNPHKAESLALVSAMIDQVLGLHKGTCWLHIGCDEVGTFIPLCSPSSSRSPPMPKFLVGKPSKCQRIKNLAKGLAPTHPAPGKGHGLVQRQGPAEPEKALLSLQAQSQPVTGTRGLNILFQSKKGHCVHATFRS